MASERAKSADWIKCVGKIRGPVLTEKKNVSVPDHF
jgi:hypothetical protein